MDLQEVLSFTVYVLINCFTPGPGNFLALNTVTTYGIRKGKSLFLGIFAGYYGVQIICAIFIYFLNVYLNPVMAVLKYVGVAYILWLAWHVEFSKPDEGNEEASPSFLTGLLLQFINVKIYFFGITALSGYVVPYYHSFGMLILFELIIATVGVIATSTWIGFGSLLRRVWLQHYREINFVMAIFLLWCAFTLLNG